MIICYSDIMLVSQIRNIGYTSFQSSDCFCNIGSSENLYQYLIVNIGYQMYKNNVISVHSPSRYDVTTHTHVHALCFETQ